MQLLAVEIFKALNNLSRTVYVQTIWDKAYEVWIAHGRNLHLSLPWTSTYDIESLSYSAANIWIHVRLEIKQCKSLRLFKEKIKTWIPEVVLVNYVRHIHHVGFLRREMHLTSCIFINIIWYYIIIYSIQLIFYITFFSSILTSF